MNWWRDWLEDEPGVGYEVFRPRAGAESFIDYWRGQRGRVYDEYLGHLGQMAMEGREEEMMDWTDFLGNYPFLQKWIGMSPERRGFTPGRYAPRMRWNVFGRSR